MYEEVFPESEFCLDEAQKETAKNELVKMASTASAPGDLAKYIIGLRALGFDAKTLYTEEFLKVDLAFKLTALVDENEASVYDPYKLSYVLIALQQAEGYATTEQINHLLSAAVATKSDWYDLTYGTDAITPMVLALAPFYETNPQVAAVVDEAIEIVLEEQREDGLIDGPDGYEPASTGLALCAFSALGIDPATIAKGGDNLIEGLLSTATEGNQGFPNAFATEQGFRGLLSCRLLTNGTGKAMYDFRDHAMEEANASGAYFCPVKFNISPTDAGIVIEGESPLKQNVYDLSEGTYTYTVSAPYYISETGTFTVTAEDETARTLKTQNVTLVYAGGGGGGSYTPSEKEPEKEEEKEPEKEPEKNELTEETFGDVKEDDWYYPGVKYVYENGLFQGTDNGFEPASNMTRAMIVTVLYRLAGEEETTGENVFSDVSSDAWYTQSIIWAAEENIIGGVAEGLFAPNENLTREQLAVILFRFAKRIGLDTEDIVQDLSSYEDAGDISSYATDAMQYAVATGLIQGRTQTEIAPKASITRAEVATILMRFDGMLTK